MQPGGRATCPKQLDTEARREWRRVAPELERMGLSTTLDRAALAAYCACWSHSLVDTANSIRVFGGWILQIQTLPISGTRHRKGDPPVHAQRREAPQTGIE